MCEEAACVYLRLHLEQKFILLILSFDMQVLILMAFNLSIFSFITCAFGVIFKELLLNVRLLRFSLCFLLRVLAFKSRSLIHFELHFCVWCKARVYFIPLHVDIQLSWDGLLKSLSFL